MLMLFVFIIVLYPLKIPVSYQRYTPKLFKKKKLNDLSRCCKTIGRCSDCDLKIDGEQYTALINF